jgi:hypothetical protein
MKTFNLIIGLLWTVSGILPARGQTESAFRREFEAFRTRTHEGFYTFRDSVNREYARYLSQNWEAFELRSPRPAPEKPGPTETPRYTPDTAARHADLPIDSVVAPPGRAMDVYPQMEMPEKQAVRPPMRLTFYGVPVEISRFDGFDIRLPSIAEAQIADSWLQLSEAPWRALVAELLTLKEELYLNDWALYRLLCQVADLYFQPARANEKTVFTVFMLNQTGYRAKIGRAKNRLVSLIAFRTAVYGKYFVTFPDGNYYVFDRDGSPEAKVYTCPLNYTPAEMNISLAVQKPFRLAADTERKEFAFGGGTYAVEYNKNLIALYQTCPQTELQVYANSSLSGATRRSLEKALLPELKGKSAKESVGFLLSFVQSAFAYQNDLEQFGYEKYFFVEEIFHYPRSDCEDRAVLFSQLVRSFTGLDVVLLDYSDHVSTAVGLGDDAEGDCIHINNVRYVVCDPTYIGAPVGLSMKAYRDRKVRVLTLN